MNRFKVTLFLAILTSMLATFASGARADQAAWQLDPNHTQVSFSIRHLGISQVRGDFTQVAGKGSYDGKNVATANVEATIQADSINTRVAPRDKHLKSADFFDVEKYPTITFKSKSFKAQPNNHFQLVGDLTMHGVTKPVTLNGSFSAQMKDPGGKIRVGATATGQIKRKDFGIAFNKVLESGAAMVGEEVTITIDVEFIKQ